MELDPYLCLGLGVPATALICWWLAGRHGRQAEGEVAYGDFVKQYYAQRNAQNQDYAVPGVDVVVEKSNSFTKKMRIALRDTGLWP